jgi:hypothetical protein
MGDYRHSLPWPRRLDQPKVIDWAAFFTDSVLVLLTDHDHGLVEGNRRARVALECPVQEGLR